VIVHIDSYLNFISLLIFFRRRIFYIYQLQIIHVYAFFFNRDKHH
jgi:hypothetical protein